MLPEPYVPAQRVICLRVPWDSMRYERYDRSGYGDSLMTLEVDALYYPRSAAGQEVPLHEVELSAMVEAKP